VAEGSATDGDTVEVLVNFTDGPVEVTPGGTVLLASDDPSPEARFTGVLGPDRAVVLRR